MTSGLVGNSGAGAPTASGGSPAGDAAAPGGSSLTGGRAEPQQVGAPRTRGLFGSRGDSVPPHLGDDVPSSGRAETTAGPRAAASDADNTASTAAAAPPAGAAAGAGTGPVLAKTPTPEPTPPPATTDSTDTDRASTAGVSTDLTNGDFSTMNNNDSSKDSTTNATSDTTAFPSTEFPYDSSYSPSYDSTPTYESPNATAVYDTAGMAQAGYGGNQDMGGGAAAYGFGAGSAAAGTVEVPASRGTADFGMFVLRLIVGALLLLHSLRIVFGLFSGPGIDNYAAILADSGFTHTGVLATVIGVTQLIAAALLILGLATPLAAATLWGLVALSALTLIAAPGKFTLLGGSDLSSSLSGGIEIHILYLVALAALLFAGGGAWGLDFGRKWATAPKWSGALWLVIVVIIVGVAWYLTNGANPLRDAAAPGTAI